MLPDGSVNWHRIPDLFHHTVETRANGVFLNGTTGECMSLSLQERLQLTEAWMRARKERNEKDFKIFVHVGSSNLLEAAQMAEHAQAQGADGFAMVPTFYFRPRTLQELLDQCEYIASAAPNIPFYFYNIPSLTGVNFPLISFLELAVRRIPNFGGIKNSFTDLVDYQHCLHFAKGKYALYWGTDEAFMMLHTGGNRHYVGSTYNYMNSLYLKMIDAIGRGDTETVLRLEGEADAIYKIILAFNNIISGKEIMRFIGIDCGPVRRPLKALTADESEILLNKLKTTTLFSYTTEKRLSPNIH
jgi:N-acetylneuraminate lyase